MTENNKKKTERAALEDNEAGLVTGGTDTDDTDYEDEVIPEEVESYDIPVLPLVFR